MNELQQAEFNILKYFDQFAKEYDIPYFLYAGTLLGSIRHEGFIPWDDDIDVGILRDDFERFERLFIESRYKQDGYTYQTRKLFPFQALEISKIRSNELNMMERMPKTQKGNYGPWVDIFPFDNVPNDEKLRKQQYNKITFYNTLVKKFMLIQVEPEDKGIKKAIKKIIQWTNETFYPVYFFMPIVFKKRQEWMTKYNDMDTTHVASMGNMYYKSYEDYTKRMFKKENLRNLTTAKFEGSSFNVPVNYDRILSRHYGDYMTLPPKSERKKHKIEYVKIEK